ncbi:hypothetical protein [Microlunatus sp. GCM10028923]|uniref:hypothetical protein n=1 Tax=Microlunatus sp. GCM10028923 TaxID=3273400 RepID=UPI00361BB1E7
MPELSRAILVIACFITIGALLMLLVVRPGTGAFVISVATVGVGVGIGAVAVVLHSLTHRNATKQSSVRPEEDKK